MSVTYLPPEVLRKSVFDLINECRQNLHDGTVDVSQVESGVRAYCESIAALPLEEGRVHKEALNELMQLISILGEELTEARDSVKEELSRLENLRKAHIAYKNFDGVGIIVKKESSDD